MTTAVLRWAPAPYRAGFTITDDTDAATLPAVRATYDVLASHGVRTTKTVWAFPPREPCGRPALPESILRGVTLADPEYRAYCEELARRGFEIALHGATAGNNRRETTIEAFELLDRLFPRGRTFICHARNADNPYWLEKVVTGGPLRALLQALLRRHSCSGEDPASPYFWGDLCLERGTYIRLYRTRNPDTLAANPSMPYHEPGKPFVPGWFSATKRSFVAVTENRVLDALERDAGMCILYQYLHRWAMPDGSAAQPSFIRAVERLAARPRIWCAPATTLLERLRLIQGVVLAGAGRTLWLVNLQTQPVEQVQIETAARPVGASDRLTCSHEGLVIARLEPGERLAIPCDRPVVPSGRNAMRLDEAGRGTCALGQARLLLNTGTAPWSAEGIELLPDRFAVVRGDGSTAALPLGRLGRGEEARLFLGQLAIVAAEVLFKGRDPDVRRWLGNRQIALEDHANWE